MNQRIVFKLALVTACLLVAVLVWSRASVSGGAPSADSGCRESMESVSGSAETCDKPVWETLPGQIFSAF